MAIADHALPPFDAPKLKISRANKHIADVRAARDDYFASNPITIKICDWPEVSQDVVVWRFRVAKEPPHTISLAIGDAIHNLRSALDVAICDAARFREKSTKGVYFPFAESESGLTEIMKRKPVARAGPAVVDLIRELKPYRGGNVGLRHLHEFDLQDKHVMIVLAAAADHIDLSALLPQADEKTRDELRYWTSVICDDSIVASMPRSYSPPVGVTIKAEYRLVIFPNDVDPGYEIVDFLGQLSGIVSRIVRYIETASKTV